MHLLVHIITYTPQYYYKAGIQPELVFHISEKTRNLARPETEKPGPSSNSDTNLHR